MYGKIESIQGHRSSIAIEFWKAGCDFIIDSHSNTPRAFAIIRLVCDTKTKSANRNPQT